MTFIGGFSREGVKIPTLCVASSPPARHPPPPTFPHRAQHSKLEFFFSFEFIEDSVWVCVKLRKSDSSFE